MVQGLAVKVLAQRYSCGWGSCLKTFPSRGERIAVWVLPGLHEACMWYTSSTQQAWVGHMTCCSGSLLKCTVKYIKMYINLHQHVNLCWYDQLQQTPVTGVSCLFDTSIPYNSTKLQAAPLALHQHNKHLLLFQCLSLTGSQTLLQKKPLKPTA